MSTGNKAAEAVLARLSVPQASAHLGISVPTLNKMRCQGRGPRYMKLGSRVYYVRADLDAYLQARIVETEDSRAAAAA